MKEQKEIIAKFVAEVHRNIDIAKERGMSSPTCFHMIYSQFLDYLMVTFLLRLESQNWLKKLKLD